MKNLKERNDHSFTESNVFKEAADKEQEQKVHALLANTRVF
jgi:hypothetical protein